MLFLIIMRTHIYIDVCVMIKIECPKVRLDTNSIAERFKKHCPSFGKTLPMKIGNVARSFSGCCPCFFKMTGNEIWHKFSGSLDAQFFNRGNESPYP